MKLITLETLEKWEACEDDVKAFKNHYKQGATLQQLSKKCLDAGEYRFYNWLWDACSHDPDYIEQTIITGGDYATLTGGSGATLTGGDGATLTGGDYATLTGGNHATLTGGNHATLTGGYGAILTGGYDSALTGGNNSTLTGGDGAIFYSRYWNGNIYIPVCAKVGINGIKPNVAYKVNDRGIWVEAEK